MDATVAVVLSELDGIFIFSANNDAKHTAFLFSCPEPRGAELRSNKPDWSSTNTSHWQTPSMDSIRWMCEINTDLKKNVNCKILRSQVLMCQSVSEATESRPAQIHSAAHKHNGTCVSSIRGRWQSQTAAPQLRHSQLLRTDSRHEAAGP